MFKFFSTLKIHGEIVSDRGVDSELAAPLAMASISKRRRNEASILHFFRYQNEGNWVVPKILLSKTEEQSLFKNTSDRNENEEN